MEIHDSVCFHFGQFPGQGAAVHVQVLGHGIPV